MSDSVEAAKVNLKKVLDRLEGVIKAQSEKYIELETQNSSLRAEIISLESGNAKLKKELEKSKNHTNSNEIEVKEEKSDLLSDKTVDDIQVSLSELKKLVG